MAYDKAIYKKLFGIVAPIAFQYVMASLVTASNAFPPGTRQRKQSIIPITKEAAADAAASACRKTC